MGRTSRRTVVTGLALATRMVAGGQINTRRRACAHINQFGRNPGDRTDGWGPILTLNTRVIRVAPVFSAARVLSGDRSGPTVTRT